MTNAKRMDWEAAEEGLKLASMQIVFRETALQKALLEHAFRFIDTVDADNCAALGGINLAVEELWLIRHSLPKWRTLP